jgi:hypothetical protein
MTANGVRIRQNREKKRLERKEERDQVLEAGISRFPTLPN